jgi:hypothetical protein
MGFLTKAVSPNDFAWPRLDVLPERCTCETRAMNPMDVNRICTVREAAVNRQTRPPYGPSRLHQSIGWALSGLERNFGDGFVGPLCGAREDGVFVGGDALE